MKTMQTRRSIRGWLHAAVVGITLGLAALAVSAQQAGQQASPLEIRPASLTPFATRSMMLDATRAGARIVAVGDRGTILLSDDEGSHWRQARAVPVNATLNAVSFTDANNGWAAGHWGVILHTRDGGETWTTQRVDTGEDRPFYSVWFSDAEHGIAAGLWSLLLRTTDGGLNWEEVTLSAPPGDTRADRNLMSIFASPHGDLFIVGERGTVLRSRDGGRNWDYRETGYHGSFWTGAALSDATLLIGGLRGSLYRSVDGGDTWTAMAASTQSSITHMVAFDNSVFAVALDGVTLESSDRGASFVARQREDRVALTAALPLNDGRMLMFSRAGIVSD